MAYGPEGLNSMTKPAFIKWHGKRNGQERKATLRSGAAGAGSVLATINYWPESAASIDAAYKIFADVAKSEGYMIVGTDRD